MENLLTEIRDYLKRQWGSLKPSDDSGLCLYSPEKLTVLQSLVCTVDRLWGSSKERIVQFFETPHVAQLMTDIIRLIRMIHGSRVIRIQRFEFCDQKSGLDPRIADQWFRWQCRAVLLMVFWQQHAHQRAYVMPGFSDLIMTLDDLKWLFRKKVISKSTATFEKLNLDKVMVPPLSVCKQQISQLLNSLSGVTETHPAWKKMFFRIYIRFCFFVTDLWSHGPEHTFLFQQCFGEKTQPNVHDVTADLDPFQHCLTIEASQNLEVSVRGLFAYVYRDQFLRPAQLYQDPGGLDLPASTYGLLCLLADIVVHSTISTDVLSNTIQMVLGLCTIPGGVEQMERLSLRWSACSQQFMISYKPELYDTLCQVIMTQTGIYTLLAEAFQDLGRDQAFPQVTKQMIQEMQNKVPLSYRKMILQALCVVILIEVSNVMDPQIQINDFICLHIYHDRFERWGIKGKPPHPRLISPFGDFELLMPDGSRYHQFPVNSELVVSAIQPVVFWLDAVKTPTLMLTEFSCILQRQPQGQ